MSDIFEDLEEDLNWREAELTILKVKALTAPEDYKIVLLRALTALLYAHMEGFFRFSWERIITEFEVMNLPRNNFSDEIITFSLAKDFNRIKNSYSDKELFKFSIREFGVLMNQSIIFEKRFGDSENLYPEKIQRECDKIGITLHELENYSIFVKALISRRNDIAHGKFNQIKTIEEYQQFEKAALAIMYDLFYQIYSVIDNQSYLKAA